jgi:hypothetical protein
LTDRRTREGVVFWDAHAAVLEDHWCRDVLWPNYRQLPSDRCVDDAGI